MPQIIGVPNLSVSRPALALLQKLASPPFRYSFQTIAGLHPVPRTTVVRHLGELVDAQLLYRHRRDDYIVPRQGTLALLLFEPDAYTRSLLLHDDALGALGAPRWAFACIPVRRYLDFDIPYAIPVVPLPGDEHPRPSPTILWYDYDPKAAGMQSIRLPTPAAEQEDAIERALPVMPQDTALALLASTGDSRLVKAVKKAAKTLDIPLTKIAEQTKAFAVRTTRDEANYPNTVILPAWLERIAETARSVHIRKAVQGKLDVDDTHNKQTPQGGAAH